MSTQQDIYATGSENRPHMLNKDNYVPWSSRIIQYARSRPNGKMIVDSIENGPYVRRMIVTPGELDLPVPVPESFHEQTGEELTENDIKQMDADDQAIQAILLGLPEYVYAAIENIAANLKFLNNLQPEWKRHVTIVRQTKNPHEADFTQIYAFLKMNEDEVNELKAERLAKTHDPLALMAHSQNSYNFLAFQLTAPTNNNQRTSSNPRNRQITQSGMNMSQDRQSQNVGGNGGNQFGQYVGQVAQNQQGYNAWQNEIANHNETGNIVSARAEGIGNGNQARCYNCRGLGHIARNCTARPKRRDAAYLLTQLLIAQKEEAGIQLQAEEFDFMAAVGDLDEIEEVNANCILMANLQNASTSGTQLDKAPVYDTNGSAEEDRFLDKEVDLEAKIKDLDNILLKKDQTVQTMHMLNPKPNSLYHPDQKMALEVHKIISHEISPIINQVDAMVQNFEIQFLQEATKFVRDFKSLTKEADESLDKQKSLELKIKRLLKASVSHDIMSMVQNGFVDVSADLKTELDHTKEKIELCIIKKEKEYAVL
nr:hypothetical protein [Tanacetum cinerariifolium]